MKSVKDIKLYDIPRVKTMREMLELAANESGSTAAFMYREGKNIVSHTYSEFAETTYALGTALIDLGFGESHTAVIGENSYPWICVYLTVLQSSGVFVPVDKELPAEDIFNVLHHSDSEIVFCSEKYEKIFRENRDKIPFIKKIICFAATDDDGDFLSYSKLVERGRQLRESGDRSFDSAGTGEYDLKMLVYTSGTTGMSKGVMLSEHNLAALVSFGPTVSDVRTKCLSVLPYHHTYEAVAGILVGLHRRATICINSQLTQVLKNLQVFKPDYIYLVPAFVELFYKKIWQTAKKEGKEKGLKFLIALSNALRKIGIDKRRKFFSSIHESFGGNLIKIVCGGAPVRPELGDFFDSIGINLINGYGISECSPLVSANREEINDCSTVGIVIPCCKVKFINKTDDGEGEICVKGDTVMMGYYKMPELTAEVLKDGWFMTGDYGKMNENGLLMITGRKKNLIVLSNGKNIFPEELENYIQSIPYVKEVIVSGERDKDGSEIGLCAEVYPDPEMLPENLPETLRTDIDRVTEALPIYKRITSIKIRDTEFEKTTSNKIKRKY